MNRILIGGIGNVLLGDDGVGPYVIQVLEALYSFGADVELVDLGTPALDLTHRLVGLHSAILIDSVRADAPAGTIVLYRKNDIFGVIPAQRLDPHSPALSECLMTAEMLGATPDCVLLIGVVGKRYDPKPSLSPAVAEAVGLAIEAILAELGRLNVAYQRRAVPRKPDIWWSEEPVHTRPSPATCTVPL